jgi:hypothetical protein
LIVGACKIASANAWIYGARERIWRALLLPSSSSPFRTKNNDVFALSTSDLVGVRRDIVEHKLYVNPLVNRRKQKLCKMAEEKVATTKLEVQ